MTRPLEEVVKELIRLLLHVGNGEEWGDLSFPDRDKLIEIYPELLVKVIELRASLAEREKELELAKQATSFFTGTGSAPSTKHYVYVDSQRKDHD